MPISTRRPKTFSTDSNRTAPSGANGGTGCRGPEISARFTCPRKEARSVLPACSCWANCTARCTNGFMCPSTWTMPSPRSRIWPPSIRPTRSPTTPCSPPPRACTYGRAGRTRPGRCCAPSLKCTPRATSVPRPWPGYWRRPGPFPPPRQPLPDRRQRPRRRLLRSQSPIRGTVRRRQDWPRLPRSNTGPPPTTPASSSRRPQPFPLPPPCWKKAVTNRDDSMSILRRAIFRRTCAIPSPSVTACSGRRGPASSAATRYGWSLISIRSPTTRCSASMTRSGWSSTSTVTGRPRFG